MPRVPRRAEHRDTDTKPSARLPEALCTRRLCLAYYAVLNEDAEFKRYRNDLAASYDRWRAK
jgi:hypothetical protein